MQLGCKALSVALVCGFWAGTWGADKQQWQKVTLANPDQTQLRGALGEALQRGIQRLSASPYTREWLLADVSFEVSRIFTNYSGDVSGRFIELASLTSPPGGSWPETLKPVLGDISRYQKADGHFGMDMDFSLPVQKLSPPIPMLWGNARLLVGLVAAATRYNDSRALTAARKLGDFYVNTADVFCAPAREAEFRATGTGGDGYTCCFFPAIEGLALLYRATGEQRYLDHARRMAEWFKRFDALPTEHSHGNLCAWRGILELYGITGERSYLERALAKWETAVQDGFVWSLGGVGEHWYRFHIGDEGCSESDWLRFNLQLWRFTGETRFLDMAERLLHNQYLANQCANGGYGWRHFDGTPAGPIGTRGPVEEWNFCCSFHGPLGLHFLKAYLVTSSEDGLYINFPIDFQGRVGWRNLEWEASVACRPNTSSNARTVEIEVGLGSQGSHKISPGALFIRQPGWAKEVRVLSPRGKGVPFRTANGYVRIERSFTGKEKVRCIFTRDLGLERRGFAGVQLSGSRPYRVRDATILNGPEVLFASPARSDGKLTLLALSDTSGRLLFPKLADGTLVSPCLPGLDVTSTNLGAELGRAQVVALRPERELRSSRRSVFTHDLMVVPQSRVSAALLDPFIARAERSVRQAFGPYYGEHLESRPEAWNAGPQWHFLSNALHVVGGDIGLLDGETYADYRFEFDLKLPAEGNGVAGWVVRAQDTGDCLHFQVQSADSPYEAPQYKTRPNTLRPHVRRNGEWTIGDPVALPVQLRRGETHRWATQCRGSEIQVFLDGKPVYRQQDEGRHAGTVGFRAAGPAEQGLFSNISLLR